MNIVQYAIADDGTPLHYNPVVPAGLNTYPVVILFPGGGFKALFPIPLQVSRDLVNAGFLVYNQTQYRTAPPNKLPGQISDGRFPNQTNDCALAVQAALDDIRCNGTVFIVGGSAGGYEAMWQATNGLVKAAVALSPPTQLDDPTSLQNPMFRNDVNNYAPGNLDFASPNNLLFAGEPPLFVVAFQQDHMPAPQYDLAVTKLGELGAPAQFQLLPGAGHSWDAWPYISAQVIQFLQSNL